MNSLAKISITVGVILLHSGALAQPRTLTFSGLEWNVRSHTGGPGGADNLWSDSPESAWVDSLGQLHLKLRKENGIWRSVEVYTVQPTRYGTHRFWMDGPMDQLANNARVGLFLYASSGSELDIEFARWANEVACQNASFSIHPSREVVDPCIPSSTYHPFHLLLGATYSSHTIDWNAATVLFQSIEYLTRGPDQCIAAAQERVFREQDTLIPAVGEDLRIHINLWLNAPHGRPAREGRTEIVIVGVEAPLNPRQTARLSDLSSRLEFRSPLTQSSGGDGR